MQKVKSRTSDVYRVEKLVGKRLRANRTEYLVKWQNWSEEHNTWEPERNILDKRLIHSYEKWEKRQKAQQLRDPTTNTGEREHNGYRIGHSVGRHPRALQHSTKFNRRPTSSNRDTPITENDTTNFTALTSSPASPCVDKASPGSRSPVVSHSLPASTSASTYKTATTVTCTDSLLQTSTTSYSDLIDWSSDRRFRRTTLLVAAASASAANAAAALAHSKSVVKHSHQTQSSSQTQCTNETSRSNLDSQPLTLKSSVSPVQIIMEAVTSSTTELSNETRPKIRLTIPRDRILPPSDLSTSSCSATSLNTSGSSSHNEVLGGHTPNKSSSLKDNLTVNNSTALETHDNTISTSPDDRVHFLAPVEIPRKSVASPHYSYTLNSGVRLPELHIRSLNDSHSDTDAVDRSPKWNKYPQSSVEQQYSCALHLPKLVLSANPDLQPSKKRISSDHSVINAQETKRRRHIQKREKRRQRHANVDGSSLSKIRRKSVDSLDADSLTTAPPYVHPKTANDTLLSPVEELPRLAPLRIQLPRSISAQFSAPSSLTSYHPISNRSRYPNLTPPFSAANKVDIYNNIVKSSTHRSKSINHHRPTFNFISEICITDITVDGITISIKECTSPKDFFGIPSTQLVHLNGISACVRNVCNTKNLPHSPLAHYSDDENVAPGSCPSELNKLTKIDELRQDKMNLSTILEESHADSVSNKSNKSLLTDLSNIDHNVEMESKKEDDTTGNVKMTVPTDNSISAVVDDQTCCSKSIITSSTVTITSTNSSPTSSTNYGGECTQNSVSDNDTTGPTDQCVPVSRIQSVCNMGTGIAALPNDVVATTTTPLSISPIKKENTTTTTIACDDGCSSSSSGSNIDSADSNTSTIMLAATEAAMKSSLQAPSSPGLLSAPRRSSTPVDNASTMSSELVEDAFSSTTTTRSCDDTHTNTPTTSTLLTNTIMSNKPISHAGSQSISRRNVNTKSTSNTMVSCSGSGNSNNNNRPTATIFGQVRTRGTGAAMRSHLLTNGCKSRTKSLDHELKCHTTIASTNRCKSQETANTVYAFQDKPSPTGYGSSDTNFHQNYRLHSSTNQSRCKQLNKMCTNSRAAVNNSPGLGHLSKGLSIPPAVNFNPNPDTALATAVCLQQLQLQFMYNNNPTNNPAAATAAAVAAAFSALTNYPNGNNNNQPLQQRHASYSQMNATSATTAEWLLQDPNQMKHLSNTQLFLPNDNSGTTVANTNLALFHQPGSNACRGVVNACNNINPLPQMQCIQTQHSNSSIFHFPHMIIDHPPQPQCNTSAASALGNNDIGQLISTPTSNSNRGQLLMLNNAKGVHTLYNSILNESSDLPIDLSAKR